MHELIAPARLLASELRNLHFTDPVACVYRPLDYAWLPYQQYLQRYGHGPKRVVFLGMNPGPFGMAQTGVPFGEVAAVRDWLGIQETVRQPAQLHTKRPIEGFQCPRSEVSGRRLWGLFASHWGTPQAFFKDHFVLNYCPLLWLNASGANLTPDKLPTAEMLPVEQACLQHLTTVLGLLRPSFIIGIGAFAEERLRRAAQICGTTARLGRILHPSPASPAANRNWAATATNQLTALGVWP